MVIQVEYLIPRKVETAPIPRAEKIEITMRLTWPQHPPVMAIVIEFKIPIIPPDNPATFFFRSILQTLIFLDSSHNRMQIEVKKEIKNITIASTIVIETTEKDSPNL